jgi:electron transport complex protein RnfG
MSDKQYKKYMLAIITMVSGLLISFFVFLLEPQIQATRRSKEIEIRKGFFPGGKYFIKSEQKDLLIVQDENKNDIGYLFTTQDPNGYGGMVKFLVAMNADWTIRDFLMTEHAETPGLGTKVNASWFREGFQGKMPLKNSLPDDKKEFPGKLGIEAISGATLSSMATVRALEKKGTEYFDWWKNRLQKKMEKAEQFVYEELEKFDEEYNPRKYRRRRYPRYIPSEENPVIRRQPERKEQKPRAEEKPKEKKKQEVGPFGGAL